DRLPVLAELCQFRKTLDRDHRLVRNRRAGIHEDVIGCEIRRVIAKLARDPQPLPAAEMHIHRRRDEDIENNELWREKLFQHCRSPRPRSVCTRFRPGRCRKPVPRKYFKQDRSAVRLATTELISSCPGPCSKPGILLRIVTSNRNRPG